MRGEVLGPVRARLAKAAKAAMKRTLTAAAASASASRATLSDPG